MGERLTAAELAIFRNVAGDRADPPSSRAEEAAFIVGRRGVKDRAASVLATYIAGLCDHRWSPVSAASCCASRGVFGPGDNDIADGAYNPRRQPISRWTELHDAR
jgi:hypothetical protein